MKRARAPFQSPAPRAKVAKKKMKSELAMYKNINNNVRLVKRHADQGTITCVLASDTFGAFTFQLNNVPKNGEFTQMYDQYKINAVNLTFYPQLTEVSNLGPTTVQNARIFTAIDYTDAAIPTALNDVREYENCEVNSIVKEFSVYIDKPKFTDTTGSLRSGYIATSSPFTLHYGLKYAVETLNPGTSGAYTFRVEATYYMSFKAVK